MAKITKVGMATAAAAVVSLFTTVDVQADVPRPPVMGQEYFGIASWYGPGFQGQRTASGERFNTKTLTAAHPSLPFGTLVEVSRTDGKKKAVVVCITDRGPFTGRAIDLSRAAARRLHMTYLGTAPVKLQVIGMAE